MTGHPLVAALSLTNGTYIDYCGTSCTRNPPSPWIVKRVSTSWRGFRVPVVPPSSAPGTASLCDICLELGDAGTCKKAK
jgi:hypothetical protein